MIMEVFLQPREGPWKCLNLCAQHGTAASVLSLCLHSENDTFPGSWMQNWWIEGRPVLITQLELKLQVDCFE